MTEYVNVSVPNALIRLYNERCEKLCRAIHRAVARFKKVEVDQRELEELRRYDVRKLLQCPVCGSEKINIMLDWSGDLPLFRFRCWHQTCRDTGPQAWTPIDALTMWHEQHADSVAGLLQERLTTLEEHNACPKR